MSDGRALRLCNQKGQRPMAFPHALAAQSDILISDHIVRAAGPYAFLRRQPRAPDITELRRWDVQWPFIRLKSQPACQPGTQTRGRNGRARGRLRR